MLLTSDHGFVKETFPDNKRKPSCDPYWRLTFFYILVMESETTDAQDESVAKVRTFSTCKI